MRYGIEHGWRLGTGHPPGTGGTQVPQASERLAPPPGAYIIGFHIVVILLAGLHHLGRMTDGFNEIAGLLCLLALSVFAVWWLKAMIGALSGMGPTPAGQASVHDVHHSALWGQTPEPLVVWQIRKFGRRGFLLFWSSGSFGGGGGALGGDSSA